MYCIKCGKENADDALFCQKCGNAFEAEEETRVAQRNYLPPRPSHQPGLRSHLLGQEASFAAAVNQGGEAEERVFSITPTLKFVYAGYIGAVLGAFLIVALFSVFTSVAFWIAGLIGLLLLLIPAFYHFKQKLTRYTLTDTTIEIDKGLISRTTQNIPLRRVQDVTVSATIAQRILGFGDIMIDNASEEGGKVILDNIDSPKKYADILLRQMRQLDK